MKKFFYLLFASLAVLASCGKENDVNSDQPSGGDEGGGEGGYAEISSIEIPSSLEMDVDWSGVMLDVKLSPSNATMDDVKGEVGDGSVVSIEKQGNGFLVKPLKVGSTTVKVSATKGGASSKTCSVKVNEKGMTEVVEVSKCELLSSDELDKRTLQDYSQLNGTFKVKLTPSNAKLWDDMTWSVDKPDWVESIGPQKGMNYGDGKYGFYVVLKKNSSNATGRTGTMYVTLTPKKGSGSLKVPITVCGHIYKVEYAVLKETSNSKIENGEIHLTVGESITLTPTISKTGNLVSGDGLNYSIPSGSGLSVSSNTLSLSSSASSNNAGMSVGVKDKFGKELTSFKVHTYAAPAAMWISKVDDGKSSYYTGDQVSFTVSVNPSTARQKWEATDSYYEVVSQTASTLKIKITGGGAVDSKKVNVACAANKSIGNYAYIYVDSYKSTDLKIGDYVVYNSSTKKFRQMDGGVRAYNSPSWRTASSNQSLNKPGSLSSGEKIVGIVTRTISDDGANTLASKWDCRLQGFTNVSGHARMVSLTNGEEWRWSDATYSESDFKNWWTGTTGNYMKSLWGTPPAHAPGDYSASEEYRTTMGWIEFNKRMSSATPRVKAVYSATDYNTSCPLPAPTTASSGGTTQWLLPIDDFSKTEVSLLNEALTYAKNAGTTATKLDGKYWTACYKTYDNTSYYLDIANGTYSSTSRSTSYPARLVCYL